MVRSAFYAKEAADLFGEMTEDTKEDYTTALYWMGLNFGTLCRIGGGGTWTAERAHEIAEQALSTCMQVREEINAGQAKTSEVTFAKGVLAFCKAEAMAAGAIQPQMGQDPGAVTRELQEEALQTFTQAYEEFTKLYSSKHLDSVKCITMLGLLCRRLGNNKDALGWASKEVKIREEILGELHPRTQQARRVYTELIDKMQAESEEKGKEAGGA